MSDTQQVVDTSKQRVVIRLYVATMLATVAFMDYLIVVSGITGDNVLLVFVWLPVTLLFLSVIFGVASKRAVDIISDEWKTQKVKVPLRQYEEMASAYEDAYRGLLETSGVGCGGCCTGVIVIVVALGLLAMSITYGRPLISVEVDTAVVFSIAACTASLLAFMSAYRATKVDKEMEVSPAPRGALLKYGGVLDRVDGVDVFVEATLARRGELSVIRDAEVVATVEGLPGTAKIKLLVTHSGFDYPYLVGTIYKGPPVTEERRVICRDKYSGIAEFSTDDDVTVIVARYDIPKRTRSVPTITESMFETLTVALVREMKLLVRTGGTGGVGQ